MSYFFKLGAFMDGMGGMEVLVVLVVIRGLGS